MDILSVSQLAEVYSPLMWAMLTKLEVDPLRVMANLVDSSFFRALMMGWGELSFRKRLRLVLLSLMRQQKVGMWTSLR